MNEDKQLPLRVDVGIVLLNQENNVFVGKRIDNPSDSWQMPQGGIEKNENFLEAAISTFVKSVIPSVLFAINIIPRYFK